MRRIRRYGPSPALVVASLALIAALAGTGFATTPAATRAAPTGADAYSTFMNGPEAIGSNGQLKLVANLKLPKGKYVIWAKGYFLKKISARTGATCVLQAGADSDESQVSFDQREITYQEATLATNVVHTFGSSGSANFNCATSSSSRGAVDAYMVKITAIRVGNLTNIAQKLSG